MEMGSDGGIKGPYRMVCSWVPARTRNLWEHAKLVGAELCPATSDWETALHQKNKEMII